jgi:hypothetical protein
MNSNIIVNQVTSEESLITVETVNAEIFNVITEGLQGPPGPSGIDGYAVSIALPEEGDLLTFNANNSIWTNVNRTSVSDGGNF